MRSATSEYLQEESRLRGARPRVKAVLYPFDLDYGLAPGNGEFVHTLYGGEPGKLVLEAGYITSGSWTSPLMSTLAPYLKQAVPNWEDRAGILDVRVRLRGAATPAEVPDAAYASLSPGEEADLEAYFQLQVEFQETFRGWALDTAEEADGFSAYAVDQAPDGGYESCASDGAFPGYLAQLSLIGRLILPESEILEPGCVRLELSRDFSEFRAGQHQLVLDNRRGQWVPGAGDFYLLGLPWQDKQVALHHGWERPDGQVDWLLLYQGILEGLGDMAHGWRDRHQARLDTRDEVAARLQRLIGVPSPQGERQPFMRGAYLASAELELVTPAQVSEPVKNGAGSAVLNILGDYRGDYSQEYLVQAESSGEVGAAACRWSTNGGQSWRQTGLATAGAEDPLELEEGLAVYWEAGSGPDLAAGDSWTFAAQPPRYQYRVYGAPFEEIAAVFLNGEEQPQRVAADAATGVILVSGLSAQVEARVVKDHTTHPVDIIADILAAVGLDQAVHQDSFALAKSLTPSYAVGVCFENLSAAQALRHILQRCLFDFWSDFGEIKLRAYLGE